MSPLISHHNLVNARQQNLLVLHRNSRHLGKFVLNFVFCGVFFNVNGDFWTAGQMLRHHFYLHWFASTETADYRNG